MFLNEDLENNEFLNEKVLTSKDRNKLKDTSYGIPELRKFPLIDAKHVRSAISYFQHCPPKFKKSLARNISVKAKQFGIKIDPKSPVASFLENADINNLTIDGNKKIYFENLISLVENYDKKIEDNELISENEILDEAKKPKNNKEKLRIKKVGKKIKDKYSKEKTLAEETELLEQIANEMMYYEDEDILNMYDEDDIIDDNFMNELECGGVMNPGIELFGKKPTIPANTSPNMVSENLFGGKEVEKPSKEEAKMNIKADKSPSQPLKKTELKKSPDSNKAIKSEMVNRITGRNVNIGQMQGDEGKDFQFQNHGMYDKIKMVTKSDFDLNADEDNFFYDRVKSKEIHDHHDVEVDHLTGKDIHVTHKVNTINNMNDRKDNDPDQSNMDLYDPIAFGESDCRIFEQKKKGNFYILESDMDAVFNYYKGTKDGYAIFNLICEYHKIKPENTVIYLAEGILESAKKIKLGRNKMTIDDNIKHCRKLLQEATTDDSRTKLKKHLQKLMFLKKNNG